MVPYGPVWSCKALHSLKHTWKKLQAAVVVVNVVVVAVLVVADQAISSCDQ